MLFEDKIQFFLYVYMNVFRKLFLFSVGIGVLYALGRLYFAVTGGFLPSNITADLSGEPAWGIVSPSKSQSILIRQALNQEYVYLGKGCQSYVFASQDGEYVIKFIKYQRFRPQVWLEWLNEGFAFLPPVRKFYAKKHSDKRNKLDKLLSSWKLAYEELQPETGILFVHLNDTLEWNQELLITDKVGFQHHLQLGKMQFLLQRRAEMLSKTLNEYMSAGQTAQAEQLIDRLLEMLVLEYARGLADNDHALMQNTGVRDGRPIHIDAGQFIYNPVVQSKTLLKREIYDKTFKFLQWLQKHYPSLAEHLKARLIALIGVEYFYMLPYVHKGDVNKIPHVKKRFKGQGQ
jgi:hypothetical protein